MEYKDAGVDIEAADSLVNDIKGIVSDTKRSEVIGGIGHFGALFELPTDRYKQPVLVSSTDGVGTKLKLAISEQQYSGIGIDLVAMCVNDVAVMGAEPLFFLDYYSTSKLDKLQAKAVISSIASGCKIAGAAFVGGETAEMPNLYQKNDFDLAGFCVGCIEKEKIIDINNISAGDLLIGINSSGVHSNGFSLVNHLLKLKKLDLKQSINGETLANKLLKPTTIYVDVLKSLFKQDLLLGAVHITGGGLTENIPRVLPEYTQAKINLSSWSFPDLFKAIQEAGSINIDEMLRVFNCGIGMTLIVKPNFKTKVQEVISNLGYKSWVIGEIFKQSEKQAKVCFI